jgi:signal transduction histidine kinase
MQKRNVKYGVFLSLVTSITLLLKMKSIIQGKGIALTQSSKKSKETLIDDRGQVPNDLHYHLGHTLTSMITCLDALPFLIKNNPEEAELQIKEMSTTARKALDEVRKTIQA